MHTPQQHRDDRTLIAGLVLVISLLSALPLLRLLIEGFTAAGGFSLAPFERALADPATWIAARNSLETAIGGTIIAVALGTVVALLMALTDFRGRPAFVFCFVVPLMIAPQVVALAWLQVCGPASPLLKLVGLAPPIGGRNPLYSREGIILLLGLHYAPLVFLTVRAGLRRLPRELIEAALAAGAGPSLVLRSIVLPLMTPALVAGTAIAFVSCIGNFGIAAFLGIPGKYLVLPTLIYQRLAGLGPSVLSEVAVLSTIVGVLAVGGLLVQEALMRGKDFRIVTTALPARPFALGRWRLAVEVLAWGLTIGLFAVPMLGLLAMSLVPAHGVPLNASTATIANYAYVIGEHAATRRALVNSLSLAGGAAVLLVLVALPLGYVLVWGRSRWLRLLGLAAELPYVLPGVVLAIALILLLLKPIPFLGIALYNTVWIILVAYLARFLVLGLRPILSGYQQLDRALEEAAQAAGAGLLRRLVQILAPMIAPVAAAGALLVFLTAFNELTVSALLWSSGAETLGIVVFAFEQAGESNFAAALAVMTIGLTILLMLATVAFARRLPEGVLPWHD